jgi:hypothetical protein
VIGERKGHAEGERFGVAVFAFFHQPRQRAAGDDGIGEIAVGEALQGGVKLRRHRDGIAV